MPQMVKYKMGAERIRRALLEGMEWKTEDRIQITEGNVHRIFFHALDNRGLTDRFGQLHMEWELPADSLCTVYALTGDTIETVDAYLGDSRILSQEKQKFLIQKGALVFTNTKDMLLYEKPGRFLWLAVEILAQGQGELFHISVTNPGENFMQTFPEIYWDTGGFFHRYLSVFSCIYGQIQERINHLEELIDLDTMPKELLPMFGEWLGIDCSGDFLSPKVMRSLLKQASTLNQMKGTRQVLIRLVELLLLESPVIIERNIIEKYMQTEEAEVCNKLYGDSEMDVTILIHKEIEETMRQQLEFLLNQFKPARSRLHIVVLQNTGLLDSNGYLDYNAQIVSFDFAVLDENSRISQSLLSK